MHAIQKITPNINSIVSINHDVTNVDIDWEKYVDGIYCINYLPYKDRLKICKVELEKMGILNSPIFQFHFGHRSKFDSIIVDHMKPTFKDFHNERREQVTSLMMSYYHIFREAQERNLSSIMTIEDDIRFVCSKWKMKDTLDHLPKNWDFIQFDKILNKAELHRLSNLTTDGYYVYNYKGGYWGTVLALWSRKAIDYSVNLLEEQLWPVDYLVVNRDDPSLEVLTCYTTDQILVQQYLQDVRYHTVLF